MKDFDIPTDRLSIPARNALNLIDRYIDFMAGSDVRMTELKLYTDRWDELDTSIRYVSGQDSNLKEYTHRGVKIVPWEGN